MGTSRHATMPPGPTESCWFLLNSKAYECLLLGSGKHCRGPSLVTLCLALFRRALCYAVTGCIIPLNTVLAHRKTAKMISSFAAQYRPRPTPSH